MTANRPRSSLNLVTNTNAGSRASIDKEGSSASVTPPSTEKMDVEQPPAKPLVEPVKQPEKVVERKPSEVAKSKAVHVKGGSSAGLQVESVLQRKTGNLKEIYELGTKLGQGQFGTTVLCIEKATGKLEFACKTIAKSLRDYDYYDRDKDYGRDRDRTRHHRY